MQSIKSNLIDFMRLGEKKHECLVKQNKALKFNTKIIYFFQIITKNIPRKIFLVN